MYSSVASSFVTRDSNIFDFDFHTVTAPQIEGRLTAKTGTEWCTGGVYIPRFQSDECRNELNQRRSVEKVFCRQILHDLTIYLASNAERALLRNIRARDRPRAAEGRKTVTAFPPEPLPVGELKVPRADIVGAREARNA